MLPPNARRAARLLLASAAALPARLAAAEEAEPPPIVVTGERLERAPSTREALDAARIDETVNVVNVEDALRYLPSLLVRKRHIGDTQAPLATRTSGVGASARSLIYADGVLLSALIGNNNTIASPRWGMVSPERDRAGRRALRPVRRRLSRQFDRRRRQSDDPPAGRARGIARRSAPASSISASTARRATFAAWQAEGSWGGRAGRFAWLVGANHVSQRKPAARLRHRAAPGRDERGRHAGDRRLRRPQPHRRADLRDRRRRLRAAGQDNLKLKLAFDLTPRLRLVYRGGLFLNDTDARAETYLRDAGGAPVYAGTVNIDGRAVTIPASAFSNNVYRLDERHWMHALTLESAWRRRRMARDRQPLRFRPRRAAHPLGRAAGRAERAAPARSSASTAPAGARSTVDAAPHGARSQLRRPL